MHDAAISEAAEAVRSAERAVAGAERALAIARMALAEAERERIVVKFRDVHREVLYELRIGGQLVRYETQDGVNLPRRFAEKPGCLVSGEFDRRTPVSDTTMRTLVASGLTRWTQDQGGPVEMTLTPAGEHWTEDLARPTRRAA